MNSADHIGSVRPVGRLRLRRIPPAMLVALLGVLLACAVLVALMTGAYPLSFSEVAAIPLEPLLAGSGFAIAEQQRAVLLDVRLPRVLLGMLTGAGLALSGAALQGLLRNPLADPTLIGVSSGAALGAATVIVLGATLFPGLTRTLGGALLPAAAFIAGLAATFLVYALGQVSGRTAVAVLLLAGIAVTAACEAGIGLYTYLANDEQLRNLAFWRLGSLGAATWPTLAMATPCVLVAGMILAFMAKSLNALALGETQASHLGMSVGSIKLAAIGASALAVGGLVAFTGNIGFVGLVAPHMARLAGGPDHRTLLPAAALIGATLVVTADVVARTAVMPAEMPIGIVTALVGVPFFLGLLMRGRRDWGL